MWRDGLVQHRLVVEAGNNRQGRGWIELEAVQLHREHRAERSQRVECGLNGCLVATGHSGCLSSGPRYRRNSQSPTPNAVGSRSQSGGTSQTNARIAMTHPS